MMASSPTTQTAITMIAEFWLRYSTLPGLVISDIGELVIRQPLSGRTAPCAPTAWTGAGLLSR